MRERSWLGPYGIGIAPIAAIALSIAASGAASAGPTRLGSEFQVNSYTVSQQRDPAVAVSNQGSFLLVWWSLTQDDGSAGVYARRYDAAGTALASEFQVNSFTPSHQRHPSVAFEPDGDFVVVWDDIGVSDGQGYGVRARQFDSNGVAQAVEFVVNKYTLGDQYFPRVVASANGFVVVWRQPGNADGNSFGVFGRRFSAAGAALGPDFQVNTYTTGVQGAPVIAMDTAGRFVVAWQSEGQDGQGNGIFGRRFDASGAGQAVEFQVNTRTVEDQELPAIAARDDGGFVVTWKRETGLEVEIDARVFAADGSPVAPDFQVNVSRPTVQYQQAVAARGSGAFVVVWTSGFQDGDGYGVFGRELTASGSLVTAEIQVNTYISGKQERPTVGVAGDGSFVVAWQSNGQDGDIQGIFAQRFASGVDVGSIDVDGNGVGDPLTDGLLVLRYLFGFRGATLIAGAVGPGCTRCTAPQIEAFVGGLAP